MGHLVITITLNAYYPLYSSPISRFIYLLKSHPFTHVLHFCSICMGFLIATFLWPWFTALIYLLYHYVFTPYTYHQFVNAKVHRMAFFNSEYSPFYYILLDIFLLLSISLSEISLTLTFYYLCLQLVFSHSPFTALHVISVVLKSFPSPTTIPDEGLSPKCHHCKFLSKFSYFTLGSLISYIIVTSRSSD